MTTADKKARTLIAEQNTTDLITQFELTEVSTDEHIYMVRGWLMDELEKRNPDAFWAWVDSNEESPRKFF